MQLQEPAVVLVEVGYPMVGMQLAQIIQDLL